MNQTIELFETEPWLERSLGKHVFDQLPVTPGVYRFYDEHGTLIYTGKAKNLRRRLFSYKRIRPGNGSRKVRKMISRVHSFETECCSTEKEALLLENRWIRDYRPEFNHVNKSTETYYFVKMWASEHTVRFELAMNDARQLTAFRERPLFPDFEPVSSGNQPVIFGAFKGHLTVRRAFGAFLQLFWISENRVSSPFSLPRYLTRNLAPRHIEIDLNSNRKEVQGQLTKWFSGESHELLHFLSEETEEFKNQSLFNEHFVVSAMETLHQFFEKSLKPNYEIRNQWLNGRETIPQNELDDWMVHSSSK